MSPYLIDQIEETSNIRLLPRTEIQRVEGEGHVERAGSLPSTVDCAGLPRWEEGSMVVRLAHESLALT